MPLPAHIRILEVDSNGRGDLFGRLMEGVFLALGYEDIRLSIHKTGREIDVEATHRTEHRRLFAECKATKTKTGGDDINKFVGAVDVEKHKDPGKSTVLYYISLSGFKETAVEQERETGEQRIILMNGDKVITELISGKIIVPPDIAVEKAGRCLGSLAKELKLERDYELLAQEIGFIWAIYYSRDKQKTHFALIHADGEALSPELAKAIIHSDKQMNGELHRLRYLAPFHDPSITRDAIKAAKQGYFKYLSTTCGEITLEGLPPGQEIRGKHLSLENIFVPMHFTPIEDKLPAEVIYGGKRTTIEAPNRIPLAKVLVSNSRLAVLSTPGGGKTTLLKRLAITYAFPGRQALFNDKLPDRAWMPLLIRCRELGDLAKAPFERVLASIAERAEISQHSSAFHSLVYDALRDGAVLLLIDGLDEISDDGSRITFIRQLCIFLTTYPNCAIVITSREAGFSVIGGTLSQHCKQFRIADFDKSDIHSLVLVWHKEIRGDTPTAERDARKLAETICGDSRVKQLATNPLLLTTLLLIKQWLGQLPSKRCILYGKAIEVLLMTWNVEGHTPIDQDEAVPQLSFVAYAMMKEGIQAISGNRLRKLLALAREQMPEVLTYAKFSVSEFIRHVELRSSLLVSSGHMVEDGSLIQMYEFRHLTFQEYLAARAVADGYYLGRKDSDTICTVLEQHLKDPRWEEVIRLASVLSGRNAHPLISYLVNECRQLPAAKLRKEQTWPLELLSMCIMDEAQINPDILMEGMTLLSRHSVDVENTLSQIGRGKYGQALLAAAKDVFMSSRSNLLSLGSILGATLYAEIKSRKTPSTAPILADEIKECLLMESDGNKALAALALMQFAFGEDSTDPESQRGMPKRIDDLANSLIPLLESDEPRLHFSACWAFAWIEERLSWAGDKRAVVQQSILDIWLGAKLPEVEYVSGWAIGASPIVGRELISLSAPNKTMLEILEKRLARYKKKYDGKLITQLPCLAPLVVAYYWRKPWDDSKLAELFIEVLPKNWYVDRKQYLQKLFASLGQAGIERLEQFNRKNGGSQ